MPPSYVVGLDLGQCADFSALCVLERTERRDRVRGGLCWHYGCRHLQRWPLGTPYAARPGQAGGVTEDVAALLATPPLPGCILAVDQTGVGRAVVDLLIRLPLRGSLVPVTITAGAQATRADDGLGWRVPKRELVGTLQTLLQTGRLAIARALPLALVLERELANFRARITAATNETYEAWREGDHDDLVLALAIAAWVGERSGSYRVGTAPRSARSSVADAAGCGKPSRFFRPGAW